jgi:hypothetical protein
VAPEREREPESDRTDEDLLYTLIMGWRRTLPPLFRPTFGGWFDRCIDCNDALRERGTMYFVIKHVRREETIYEMAICAGCLEKLSAGYSEASRRHIDRVFAERVNFRERFDRLQATSGRWESWVESCLFTGTPRGEARECQVVALCRGSTMLVSGYPFALCDAAIELLQAGISDETLGRWDRFVGDHLSLPPELRGLPLL